jgi:hypothetical protein
MYRLFLLLFFLLVNNCYILDYDSEPETVNCKIEMRLCIVNNDTSELYFTVTGNPDLGPQDGYSISERYLTIQPGTTAIDTIARTRKMLSSCTCNSTTPFVTLLGNRAATRRIDVFLSDSSSGLKDGFKPDSLNIVYDTIVFPES